MVKREEWNSLEEVGAAQLDRSHKQQKARLF